MVTLITYCVSVSMPNYFKGDPMILLASYVKGSAKRGSPGCVNAASKSREKWLATAAIKFTKPVDRLLAEPCTSSYY